jgi:hypothetical protein
MGRQIAIAMEPTDEDAFLAFLRASADIALFRSWSPSATSVASFVAETSASPFYIHNRAFPWQPPFERVTYTDRLSAQPGAYFRLNIEHAPLIEYSRHPSGATNPQVAGRLYWPKLFTSHANELTYDATEFDRWFSSVARWVRKNGLRLHHGQTSPWCLPAAAQRLQNAA